MEISEEQARDCFTSDDLIGIGMEADAVRRSLHPENVVTYTVSRPILLGEPKEKIYGELTEAVQNGDTSAFLVSAGSTTSFVQVEKTLTEIHDKFRSLCLHALSTAEIATLAEKAGLTLGDVLTRLRAAGLDAFSGDDLCAFHTGPGEGALERGRWLDVHRMAHALGIRSTAGLIFGMGESFEQRVELLFAIRGLQALTGGFVSFTPRSYLPPTARSEFEEPTAVEYLRTLAVSRMVLDNVANIESSCTAQGLKVTQMALQFGANDAGSIASTDIVSERRPFTEEDLRRVIRDAGLRPVERDAIYRAMFLSN